uniref:Maturase K n=1 Tax=Cuscuta africana TaxID=413235 RepID=A0A7H0DGM5_9ASTE|nr:maturase K [Cuscuta africana]QNP08485.1 maturase K [Cuscuta africana]
MHSSNYYSKKTKSKIVRTSTRFYFKLLSEGFTFILEIPFYLRFISELKKIKLVKYTNLRSLHSIFPFLEDNFSHLNSVLDIFIPYPPHLEILVEIIRYWVKDVSSLHLLRLFLHEFCNFKRLIILHKSRFLFSKINEHKRLVFLLYNFYVSEYESVFVFLRNQSLHLKSIRFGALFERNLFYGKIKCFVDVGAEDVQSSIRLLKAPDSSMHYARYRGKSILASKGTLLFMPKWNYYFVNFWQYYFSMWIVNGRINRSQLSNHSFYFLNYLSSIALTPSTVRSQMLENSFLIHNDITKIDTVVPILTILRSLEKAKFCNSLGNPMSKPGWADLSDSDIIQRFGRICKNIFHYYSGSSKKRSLYQIKYILCLSCARTLACKHKSTVRAVLKSLGSKFFDELLMWEKKKCYFTFPNAASNLWRVSQGRIWYFDIVSINEQVNFK